MSRSRDTLDQVEMRRGEMRRLLAQPHGETPEPFGLVQQRVGDPCQALVARQVDELAVKPFVGLGPGRDVVAPQRRLHLVDLGLQDRERRRIVLALRDHLRRRRLHEAEQLVRFANVFERQRHDADAVPRNQFDQPFRFELEQRFAHRRARHRQRRHQLVLEDLESTRIFVGENPLLDDLIRFLAHRLPAQLARTVVGRCRGNSGGGYGGSAWTGLVSFSVRSASVRPDCSKGLRRL